MAPRYMHSQAFADLPAEERAAHHVTAVRDFEAAVRRDMLAERDDDIHWRRRRIEGHALRAVIAMLEALS